MQVAYQDSLSLQQPTIGSSSYEFILPQAAKVNAVQVARHFDPI